VPVRISSNRVELAGITVVVQEQEKVKRVESREEFEESLRGVWIEFSIFGAERERERLLDVQVYAIVENKAL